VPLGGARIELGSASTVSAADGTYRLTEVPDEGQIVVRKAGYRDVTAEYPEEMVFDATLESFQIRAVYVGADVAADDARWNAMLELVEATELNAVVLDVKDSSGVVLYDTQTPLAMEIGARGAVYDLDDRLSDLQDREIYAIAHLVVFEDPLLAGAQPEHAIKNLETGASWTTWDGRAWVNCFDELVWTYNAEIAAEVAAAGFDEIQFDYLRFPTDGPLEVADYGAPATADSRAAAIEGFLGEARRGLSSSSATLAVNVAGTTLWDASDNGIGQDLDVILPLVDVVSPMIYPSHFSPGTFGYDFPNDHPYGVIKINLERIQERFGDSAFKFRPWLQNFSSGLGIEYGIDEVRAQIDAAEEFGSAGWMLWNESSAYSEDALLEE
jgi:hypothetical protein